MKKRKPIRRISEAKQEEVLTGDAVATTYRPSLSDNWFWSGDGTLPALSQVLRDVEAMRAHPRCISAMGYYKAGIANAKIKITKASSPEVADWALKEFSKFWQRGMPVAQASYDYGWSGLEASYEVQEGKMTFASLDEFRAWDVRPAFRKVDYAGIRVENIHPAHVESVPGIVGVYPGHVDLCGPDEGPAKAFWMLHNKRHHPWFGFTQYFGAWRPWRFLAGRDACEANINAAVYRVSVPPLIVRAPREASKVDGKDLTPGMAKARQMAEELRAGAAVALSNEKDDKGDYKWAVEWPVSAFDVDPLINVSDHWEKLISLGIGVPPELMEASETGSGYSGREIPLEGFFAGQQQNAHAMAFAWKWQIGDPLCKWNHGDDAWFEMEVEPLLMTRMKDLQGLQQPQQPGQPGQQPGQPGGEEQPSGQPPKAGAGWHPEVGPRGGRYERNAAGAKRPMQMGIEDEPREQPGMQMAGEFVEGEHPREAAGKFTEGPKRHLREASNKIRGHIQEAVKQAKEEARQQTKEIIKNFSREATGILGSKAGRALVRAMDFRGLSKNLQEQIDSEISEVQDMPLADALDKLYLGISSGATKEAMANTFGEEDEVADLISQLLETEWPVPLEDDDDEIDAKIEATQSQRNEAAASLAASLLDIHAIEFALHAPKGGITIAGKAFRGGQFIPGKVAAEATPEQQQKLRGAESERKQSLRRKTPITNEGYFRDAIAPYKDLELTGQQHKSARRAYNALKGYHGEDVLHKVSQMIHEDQAMLGSTAEHDPISNLPPGEDRNELYAKRLRSYGHMLDWAKADGMKLEPPQPEVDIETAARNLGLVQGSDLGDIVGALARKVGGPDMLISAAQLEEALQVAGIRASMNQALIIAKQSGFGLNSIPEVKNAEPEKGPIPGGEGTGGDGLGGGPGRGDGTGPERGSGDISERGSVGGGGAGGSAGEAPFSPRIVTAREHLTKRGNPDLVPESLRKHLNETQIQGVAVGIEAMDTQGGFLLADGTGTGKTRQELGVAAKYAADGKKVVIVTVKKALNPDWKKGTISGSFGNDSAAMGLALKLNQGEPLVAGHIAVTTYQKLSKIKQHIDKNTVVVFDECFEFSAPVITDRGILPIGAIVEKRLPVRVLSCNLSTNGLEWKPVTRWVKNPLVSGLVKVIHEKGEFQCTPQHKVWTEEDGYIVAGLLKNNHHLRMVPAAAAGDSLVSHGSAILRNELCSVVADGCNPGQDGKSEEYASGGGPKKDWPIGPRPISADEEKQSHADGIGPGQGVSVLARAAIPGCTRGERQAVAISAKGSCRSLGLANGSNCFDSFDSPNPSGIADELQNRYSDDSSENRARGRWFLAQSDKDKTVRYPENEGPGSSRVVRVEIYKPPNPGRFGFSCQGHPSVYNLEIGGNHNYFAYGVLVSNSHSMKNWSSATSGHGRDMASAAHSVMFASATPADQVLHISHLARAGVFGNRKHDDTFNELGMEKVEIRTPHGTISKWQINPRVGAEESLRRLDGLFSKMTEEGLMLKREISMDGLDVHYDNIQMPPEVHDQMDQIAAEIASSGKYPNAGLQKAGTLMAQRLHQEPHKIPAAVAHAQRELGEGRQVIIFAGRVNESSLGEEDEDGEGAITSEGTLKTLKASLEAAGITDISELHGGATKTAAQQEKSMQAFQSGKSRVMIATIESGGTGINLDDTVGDKPRTVVMMTPPFSALSTIQAIGRVHRLTTKSRSKVIPLVGDTDVDRWNSGIVARKMKTLNAAIGGEVGNLLEGEEAEKEPYKWSRGLRKEKQVTMAGQTYEHRDAIKAAGGRWDANAREWTLGESDARALAAKNKALRIKGDPVPEAPKAAPAAPHADFQDRLEGVLAAPPAPKSTLSIRKVNTSKGERHVHGFEPGNRFWDKWRGWKAKGGKPEYISVGKDPRSGDWQVSIWGQTAEEVEANLADLKSKGAA